MKAPQVQTLTKKQLQQVTESEFVLGVMCGAHVARQLILSGWTDMKSLKPKYCAGCAASNPIPDPAVRPVIRHQKTP